MPRFHCTYCRAELGRTLPRGTVRLYPARTAHLYALAQGALLLVCRCGRRNVLRGGKMLVAAPADQDAAQNSEEQ